MPWTSCPAPTSRGTSCFPIAPVAPATNTLITKLLDPGLPTPQDKTAARAVTAPRLSARDIAGTRRCERRARGAERARPRLTQPVVGFAGVVWICVSGGIADGYGCS